MPRADADTDVLASASGHTLVRAIRLRVLEGPDAGRSVTAGGGRVVIGTHESVDLVLTDRAVSRFHCEIVLDGAAVMINDLQSRNGTLVDGVSVLVGRLGPSATLTMGRTRIQFDLGDDKVKIPLSKQERFGQLVGRSPAMRAVFATLERAARGDATILLQGETGTGKDLAAESIHRESARRDGPFVVVDCGSIPAGLLESELFGHERGAFTGAERARAGAFEEASGGTLFLDEIGELRSDLQPKLLRVLESREVQRLGSSRRVGADVRLVAATNRNLRVEVNAQRFRSDLYYRVAVLEVTLPPLREHKEDLPLIVEALLQTMRASDHPAAARIREEPFIRELALHPWPGNVRELRNYLERCLTLEEPVPLAAPEDSGSPTIDVREPLRVQRDRWVRAFERAYLEELLRVHGDNVSAAARAAGLDRTHLHRLLARTGLR